MTQIFEKKYRKDTKTQTVEKRPTFRIQLTLFHKVRVRSYPLSKFPIFVVEWRPGGLKSSWDNFKQLCILLIDRFKPISTEFDLPY